MIQVGDKFIIEVGEVFDGAESGCKRYRIKGFDTLTFDGRGLNRLEEYSPDVDYNRGYNDAKREIALSGEYERCYERGKSDGYSDAFEDVEDVITNQMTQKEVIAEFDYLTLDEILMRYSIRDIVTIAKAYEEKKQAEQEHEFKRGDIVKYMDDIGVVQNIIGDILYGYLKDKLNGTFKWKIGTDIEFTGKNVADKLDGLFEE